MIQNAAQALFSADERSVSSQLFSGGAVVLGVAVPYGRLATMLLGAAVVVALWLLLHRTDFGLAVRATAEDWEAAALAGIDVRRPT